jgi:hypothetical protein
MYRVLSFTPKTSAVRFDIMVGKQWRGQIAFTVCPGFSYSHEELKALTIEKRPSLTGKDFVLIPTDQRV